METKNKMLVILSTMVAVLLAIMPVAIADDFAYTTIYFNVPSDTSFQLTLPGMPTNDSTTASPGVQTAWVSFNGSVCGGQIIPYVEGVSTNTQSDDPIQPIYSYDNVGNTDIDLWLRFNESLGTGISVFWNSSGCGGSCTTYSGEANSTNPTINDTEWTIIAETFTTAQAAVNVSLYGNYSCDVAYGETRQDMYHNATVA